MKKRAAVLGVLMLGAAVFAQVNLQEHQFVSGNWGIAEERLYQNDAEARLAKVNIKAAQQDVMIYEFDARYEGGAEDGHGGFGLHFFVDNPHTEASWGAGSSYLLWLNYDENPLSEDIPAGLSAQLYQSYTNSRMELVQSFDMNQYTELLTDENLSLPIHFKIIIDGNSGEVQVYDPAADDGSYFTLNIDNDLPLTGEWVVLRTNGMKLSFTN